MKKRLTVSNESAFFHAHKVMGTAVISMLIPYTTHTVVNRKGVEYGYVFLMNYHPRLHAMPGVFILSRMITIFNLFGAAQWLWL